MIISDQSSSFYKYLVLSFCERRRSMEFQFPSWPFLLSLFLPVLFFVLMKKKNSRTFLPPLPGPAKLPIIGNLHNLILGSGLIHHRLRDLALKHGPLMHLQLGQISNVIVSSSDVAREFLTTHDISFATRPKLFVAQYMSHNYLDLGFAPYGEYWREIRKMCVQELLSVKRTKSFDKIRKDEANNVVNILREAATTSTPVNLSALFISMSNNIISRSVFGNKCKYQDAFLAAMTEATELGNGFNISDFYPGLEGFLTRLNGMRYRMEKALRSLDYIFDRIVEEREENNKLLTVDRDEDMLDIILKLQKENDFTFQFGSDNRNAVLFDMFTGGSHTSAYALEWTMSELIRNPRTMEKAIDEVRKQFEVGKANDYFTDMNYMQNVLKESFRLHPPLPLILPRECRERCQVNGYMIEKNTKVIVNAWAIGRDPKKWKDPETFEPERFNGNSMDFKGSHFDLIPFGSGRRGCPGIGFGLATIELALAKVLYHFDWKMPNGVPEANLDMTELFGAAVGKKHPLILVPQLPT